MIDEGVKDAENQHSLLEEGRQKPHVFDDALVERIKRLHVEKLEFTEIYVEQIERWKKEELAMEQHFEMQRLMGELEKLKKLCAQILALTEEIDQGTIDKIVDMDDAELGLRALLGEFKS